MSTASEKVYIAKLAVLSSMPINGTTQASFDGAVPLPAGASGPTHGSWLEGR